MSTNPLISHRIINPPLQKVRRAMYARLLEHPATNVYNILKEGLDVKHPYFAVGPAYLGSGGSDSLRPVNVVVQIEAYALSREGGSKTVDEMGDAIEAAVSNAVVSLGTEYEPLIFIFEHAGINPHLHDAPGAEMYAQMIHRYRTIVIKKPT